MDEIEHTGLKNHFYKHVLYDRMQRTQDVSGKWYLDSSVSGHSGNVLAVCCMSVHTQQVLQTLADASIFS